MCSPQSLESVCSMKTGPAPGFALGWMKTSIRCAGSVAGKKQRTQKQKAQRLMEAALGFPASIAENQCVKGDRPKLLFLATVPHLPSCGSVPLCNCLLKERLIKEEPWCSNKGALLGASRQFQPR